MKEQSVEEETKCILIVDDEIEIRESLKILLEDCGYKSSVASTGREALQLIEEKNVDMIITDIRMPEMGGLDVVEKLREKDDEMPVLVITVYVYREMAVRAMQMGASGYLLKPVDFDELIHRVEMLLNA